MRQQTGRFKTSELDKAKGSKSSTPRKHPVAVVSSAHPWTDNRIHYREAATLAKAGHAVTLVAMDTTTKATPAPGIIVRTIRRRSRVSRFSLGALDALRSALSTGAVVYHLHDPELIPAIPFLRLLGKTVIYDAHEDLPSQIKDKDYIPRRLMPLAVTATKVLVRLSATANQIIAATEKIAEAYPPDRVTVIRNFPTLRAEDQAAVPVTERAPGVIYIGAFSDLRGVPQIVRAAKDFPAGWSLILAGNAPDGYRDSLHQLPGWSNAIDYGVVPPAEARDLLLSAQIGLVPFQRSTAHLDSLPTKMFEYMSAGIPVIASNFPLWRQIIEEHECGLTVDETSPSDIAAAVKKYASDPDLLARHGENARNAAHHSINWESQGEILTRLYERL
jgi:glycosyltransferase involved in cell wall biosynthesis